MNFREICSAIATAFLPFAFVWCLVWITGNIVRLLVESYP